MLATMSHRLSIASMVIVIGFFFIRFLSYLSLSVGKLFFQGGILSF